MKRQGKRTGRKGVLLPVVSVGQKKKRKKNRGPHSLLQLLRPHFPSPPLLGIIRCRHKMATNASNSELAKESMKSSSNERDLLDPSTKRYVLSPTINI
jgi:hypothetical protein